MSALLNMFIWSNNNTIDNQAKVIAAGAIPPLVALLGPSNSAALQNQAAQTLGRLAEGTSTSNAMVAAVAITPLVTLLRTSGGALEAAAALARIVQNDYNAAKVVDAGAIPIFVALLGPNNSDAMLGNAAWALYNIALKANKTTVANIIAANVVSPLTSLAQSSTDGNVRGHAQGALDILLK